MKSLVTVMIALTLAPACSHADAYVIKRGDQANQVVFRSTATLESFEGKTREVWGRLDANLANLSAGLTVHVEVDLASLDTGISLRNRHMRENHLHTDKYPLAVFHAAEILDAPPGGLAFAQKTKLRLKGDFTLHGVTLPIEIPVEVERLTAEDGERLVVTSQFEIKLPDFAIPRPKFLLLKLSDVQTISVKLVLRPEVRQ